MSSTHQHEVHVSPRTQPLSRVGMSTPGAADGHGDNASVPRRWPHLCRESLFAAAQTVKQVLPLTPVLRQMINRPCPVSHHQRGVARTWEHE